MLTNYHNGILFSHVFGINSSVRNNVLYLDDSTVLYPAGYQIVQHHIETNIQKFIPIHVEGESIACMTLNSNASILAIGSKITSLQRNASVAPGVNAGAIVSTVGNGNPASSGTASADLPDKNASIAIYDMKTAKRKKTYVISPDVPSTKVKPTRIFDCSVFFLLKNDDIIRTSFPFRFQTMENTYLPKAQSLNGAYMHG